MHKLSHHQHDHDDSLWPAVIFVILGMSFLILSFGVSGIVENKTPESMATIGTLTSSFFQYIEYHALIVTGALGFIFAAWLMERD